MIELTLSSAARLDCLARLIAQRRVNMLHTERFLAEHRTDLTPKRVEELERHLDEVREALHEMDAEYRRIAREPFNSNHSN